MFEFLVRGLDRPLERRCLAACAGLLTVYFVTFAILSIASVRVDTAFYARRQAFDMLRLPQLLDRRLVLGEPVTVSQDGHLAPSVMLLRGWSVLERWGVWTDAEVAEFAMALPVPRPASVVLEIWATVLLPPDGSQLVRLFSGATLIGSWRLRAPQVVLCGLLPRGVPPAPGLMRVEIDVFFPQRPAGGSDERHLGFGLKKVEVLSNETDCDPSSIKPRSKLDQ